MTEKAKQHSNDKQTVSISNWLYRLFSWEMFIWSRSWRESFSAAVGKAATYSFGTFVFLSIILTGTISVGIAFLTLSHFLTAISFGISVFFVSMAMEGKWKQKKNYKELMGETKDDSLTTEQKKINKALVKATEKAEVAHVKKLIDEKLKTTSGFSYFNLMLIDTLLAGAMRMLYVMSAAAKGMSAFAGTISVFAFIIEALGFAPSLVLGYNLMTYLVLGVATYLGASIAFICAGKEGTALYNGVKSFRQSTMAWMLDVKSDKDFTAEVKQKMAVVFQPEKENSRTDLRAEILHDIQQGGFKYQDIIQAAQARSPQVQPMSQQFVNNALQQSSAPISFWRQEGPQVGSNELQKTAMIIS